MLSNEIQEGLFKLRDALIQYQELNDEQKKRVRHLVYQKTGQYGRAFFQLLADKMIDIHAKLVDEGKEE